MSFTRIENNIAKLITSRIESYIRIDIIDNIILKNKEEKLSAIRNSIKQSETRFDKTDNEICFYIVSIQL